MRSSRAEKRFRVTARDNNGDIYAFETDSRERAKAKLEEQQARADIHDVQMETTRWIFP